MRQVKFLMVALTILMGTMVTSCMDGGEASTIVQGQVPMRVKSTTFGGTNFISGGLEIVPTNAMLVDLPTGTKIALVPYKYDSALQPITENTKKLDVELLGKPQSIDAPLNVCLVKEDEFDVASTHAIATLSVSNGYNAIVPYVLPVAKNMVYTGAPAEYYLVAPIGYKIKSVQKEDELTAELKKHDFTAVLYMEEVEAGDKTMVVYLRHVITETAEKEESRTMNYAEFKSFDLSEAIKEFVGKSGSNPTKVIIKAMENSSSDELKGGNEKSYEQELKIEA